MIGVIKDGGEKNVGVGSLPLLPVSILPVAVHVLLGNLKGSQDITGTPERRIINPKERAERLKAIRILKNLRADMRRRWT